MDSPKPRPTTMVWFAKVSRLLEASLSRNRLIHKQEPVANKAMCSVRGLVDTSNDGTNEHWGKDLSLTHL